MSGIAGIYSQDSQFLNGPAITLMLEALSHRGPHGTGVWNEGPISLGHQMLWTTSESLLEKLPYCSDQRTVVITADARIDNRVELISILNFQDQLPEQITDSEIILAAYEKWGEQSVEHLLGAFAFVIWDQDTDSLFCARDHIGVKPFYYHQSALGFFFASEIKALLALPQIPGQLNEVRIADYLEMMMEDKSITSYRDIQRLPPAHCMRIRPLEFKSWSYWSLNPHLKLRLDSDEAYAQKFQDIFTESVRCRLRSAFPIGCQLSGGLDSSAVTCVAKKILAEQGLFSLHTVSNIFEDVPECDERIFINEVLADGGVTPHYIHADQVSPLSELKDMWQYEDEAFIGPNHVLPWQLNQAAKQVGIRVFLDGFDGDTTVSHGIHRLTELAQEGDWYSFWQETIGLAKHFESSPEHLLKIYGIPSLIEWAKQWQWTNFVSAVTQIHQYFDISRLHLLWNYGLKPMIPRFIWARWQNFRWRIPLDQKPRALIDPSFAERIGFEQRRKIFHQNESHASSVPTGPDEHWSSLNTGLLVFVLELLDRSAAAFSVEPRHPFMDKRLIEYCLSLPSEQKLFQGWSRMVMRRALTNLLPENIQWREGKTSMTPNFLHGMLTLDPQKFEEVIRNPPKEIKDYIDLDYLRAAYGRLTSSPTPQDLDIMTVWKATILSLWLRHHHLTP